METKNNNTPSSDFFNFEIYRLPEWANQSNKVDPSKSILVLLKGAEEAEIALLGKIFQAVGKNLETDGCVINDMEWPSYKTIANASNFKQLLVFGIAPTEIGLHLNVKAYQVIAFQERQLLFSHDLKVIANDLAKKKQLWGQLQLMFK